MAERNDNASSMHVVTLLFVCKNNYLNSGLQYLINELQPEILHKTGNFCDVVILNDINKLDISTLSRHQEYCLIMEREHVPALNKIMANQTQKDLFKTVLLLSSTNMHKGMAKNFLPYKPALVMIKKILLQIMASRYDANLDSLAQSGKCLTRSEQDIFNLMINGKSMRYIAGQLAIPMHSIYACRSRILSKAGVGNVRELLGSVPIFSHHD